MAGCYLFLTLLMALRVITINANGLRDSDNRAGLLQYFRSLPSVVDVVCLQECHCSSEMSVKCGFVPPVFSLLCHLALSGLVVPLFFIVLCCPLLIGGVILIVVFFS